MLEVRNEAAAMAPVIAPAQWTSENAAAISWGIVTPLIPAAAIALLTVGVNLVADWFLHKTSGIRDVP